ncbi:MAG: hypothetical protein KGK11_00650 [Sphingomonadales bacterium]|nr:hypothetical protein [Sphingomonadales bacterium]
MPPLLLLAGCGGHDNYPSLALRPAERASAAAATKPALPAPVQNLAVSPAMAKQLDDLVADAQAGYQSFIRARPDAEARVKAAHGAEQGGESWARATNAVAALAAARATTAQPLTVLIQVEVADRLAHAEDDGTSGDAGTRPATLAITAAHDRIAKWLAEENDTLTALDLALR